MPTKQELIEENIQLRSDLERMTNKYKNAVRGRKFWRAEAQRLGTPYENHISAAKKLGVAHELYPHRTH